MLIRRTTASTIETVLACDPAVIRANGGDSVDRLRAALKAVDREDEAALAKAAGAVAEAEAARDARLAAFRRDRDMASITVPDDATLYTIRPLSTEERLTVGEAALELTISAIAAEGDASKALAIRARRIEAMARISRGLVKATDTAEGEVITVKGDQIFDCLPDALLYPAILELDHAIRRISEVDSVGKGR